jgi:rfaE bifunctional protein kinase chain/domain
LIEIENDRVEEICQAFRDKRIMVIGDLMMDEYLFGSVNRLSPEAPVPIIEIEEDKLKFGGAANVAANVKGLGCIPFLVGGIGQDSMSENFLKMLHTEGMTGEGIIRFHDRPTTVKTRIIGRSQHIARVDREDCASLNSDESQKVIALVREHIDDMDAVILEDYNKGFLSRTVIQEVIRLANDSHKTITVDPKFLNFMCFKNVSVFKPNLKETENALAVTIQKDEDLDSAAKRLLHELQAENILITRGAYGMTLYEKNGTISHVPTRAWHVADVSGAGDTVIGTLTAALTGRATVKEAATLANYAAGIVCREIGVVPITLDAIREEYLGNRHTQR